MEKFRLEIQLGNDAMQDAQDVARALEATARRMRQGDESGKIMDANGNSVGRFAIE